METFRKANLRVPFGLPSPPSSRLLPESRSMNSLRRMLDVLGLFSAEHPVLDVDAICTLLGYPPASAYRYIRELSDFGLLVRLPRGYALGPRIIELDRVMVEHDPLLVASRDLVDRLVEETGLTVLISELYDDKVINIFQRSSDPRQLLKFGRGRPMALFRSATSRVILAYLLPRQLRRVFDEHAHDSDLLHVGQTWKEFSRAMLEIRKQGWCRSSGEVNLNMTGIAAPIFDEKNRILGSITLMGSTERYDAFNPDFVQKRVTDAARTVTQRIAQP